MSTIYVYGASDDLIEIDGDVSEEFNVNFGDDKYLIFSDGTCVRFEYDGDWTLSLVRGGSFLICHNVIVDPFPEDFPTEYHNDYSDLLVLDMTVNPTHAYIARERVKLRVPA